MRCTVTGKGTFAPILDAAWPSWFAVTTRSREPSFRVSVARIVMGKVDLLGGSFEGFFNA